MPQPGASPLSLPSEPSSSPADSASAAPGASLIASVEAVKITLRGLLEHQGLLGAETLAEIERTVADVEQRLGREQLLVVVVGERQSGKSTLLDAIVGDRLLGGARGQSSVVTLLRRRSTPGFTARFASGKLDDFSRRVPDASGRLTQAASELNQALAEVERLCRSKRSALRGAIETRERAELDAEQGRSELAGARELEGTASSDLSGVEGDSARVARAVGELELAVPERLRVPPPRWAFWLWLARALFVLLRRSVWQRYQSLLVERAELEQRLATRRNLALQAAQQRQLVESGLEPLGSGADQARQHSSEVEQALREAEAERNRLRGELDALRSQQEHHESERWRQFFAELQEQCQRPDLVELAIDYPAKLLPDDVTIVDVPGLVSASDPEWQLLREQADGCILVSELDRAVSETTKQFLRQLREVVPHVLLVLTKMDQAFQEAVRRGHQEPWEQVELARRIGTRRFARELGRDANSVLSISVAAEAALSARGSELAERFDSEIEKLFLLLRQERALMLGARAADALRHCVATFSAAEARAEGAYRQRIATLEQQRTPEPDVFKQQLLDQVEPNLEGAAQEALEQASAALESGFLLLQRLCEQGVAECRTTSALVDLAGQLASDLPQRVAEVRHSTYLELETAVDRQVSTFEHGLFQAVRERYQLLHEDRRSAVSSPRLGASALEEASFGELAGEMRDRVLAHKKGRLALGMSGAVTLGTAGALVHPWLGPMLGAALGALLALARRPSVLRAQALAVLTTPLGAERQRHLSALRGEGERVTGALRSALERSLGRALLQFGRWIAEPLEAERQVIEAERQNLLQLEQLRDEVGARDQALARALEVAAHASAGLCR